MANKRDEILRRSLSFKPAQTSTVSGPNVRTFDSAMLSIQASSKTAFNVSNVQRPYKPRPPVIRPNAYSLMYKGEYLTFNNQFIDFNPSI